MSNDNEYRIMGVDPSTTCTGIALFTVDLNTNKILSIETEAIVPNLLLRNKFTAESSNSSGPEFSKARVDITRDYMRLILDKYNPHIVYSEIPHINVKHLNNVFPLSNVKYQIETTIAERGIPHYQLTATGAKSVIGANKRKGRTHLNAKERVLEDILQVVDIIEHINPIVISEDEVDAVLIAYAGHYGENITKSVV